MQYSPDNTRQQEENEERVRRLMVKRDRYKEITVEEDTNNADRVTRINSVEGRKWLWL